MGTSRLQENAECMQGSPVIECSFPSVEGGGGGDRAGQLLLTTLVRHTPL